MADLDGDGRVEVALLRADDVREHRQFFLFDANGHVRNIRHVEARRRFGSLNCAPPWLAYGAFLTGNDSGPPTLWYVHTEALEFPTLLEEVDPWGRPRSEYWSNGYIEVVKTARLGGRDVVLVGATNNDTRGASVAVFDRGQVNGSAPAENSEYRCEDCPPGTPQAFVVFPRLCLLRDRGGTASVVDVSVAGSGQVTVVVAQGGARWSEAVYYRFDAQLRLTRVELSGEYGQAHRAKERTGELDHAVGPAEEVAARAVRRWDGTRFVDVEWAPGVVPRTIRPE